jgi:hypothetical protein
MTLPFSGTLTLHQISIEFNDYNVPGSLNQLYAGGAYVPLGTFGYPTRSPYNGTTKVLIPSNGTIEFDDFYGSSIYQQFTYTLRAGNYATNFNVLSYITGQGFTNSSSHGPAHVTININGVLGATDTSSYAFYTGSGYAKTPVIVINVGAGGYITGAGGQLNQTGGNGMYLQTNVTIYNSGIIQAGGGAGGAGSEGVYGGGAGYYPGQGYGIGSSQDSTGSLDSGGQWAYNSDGGTSNGGAGGGWVDGMPALSPSTDGYGYGSPGGGDDVGTPDGGYAPGYAIVGYTHVSLGSALGRVRGPTL